MVMFTFTRIHEQCNVYIYKNTWTLNGNVYIYKNTWTLNGNVYIYKNTWTLVMFTFTRIHGH